MSELAVQEPKKRNGSIDAFRYICAIMVVSIHTAPFMDINEKLGYICSEIIPRIAVPFFFAVAGYFYIQKLEQGKRPLKKYILRILLVYVIWSCIYYLIDFIQWGHSSLKGYIVSCIYQFVVKGSHYQFWFFPALVLAVCLTTLAFKLRFQKLLIPISIMFYVIGCVGCSYYKIGIKIPGLGLLYQWSQFELVRRMLLMGFPFFVCGYVAYKINSKKTFHASASLLLVTVVLWLLEIVIVEKYNLEENIVLTFFLYPLVLLVLMVLLQDPLQKLNLPTKTMKTAANFTFYAHPLMIFIFNSISKGVSGKALSQTPAFLLAVIMSLLLSIVIVKINNKYLNMLAE